MIASPAADLEIRGLSFFITSLLLYSLVLFAVD
jgi:hypothetical protein